MMRASLMLAIMTSCTALFPAAWAQVAPSEPGGTDLIAWTQMQQPEPVQSPSTKPFTGHDPDLDKRTAPQSFIGTIRKSGEQYVLKTMDHGTYQLDDQFRAQKFDGKVVEVMGDLDEHHNTIRVQSIKSGG